MEQSQAQLHRAFTLSTSIYVVIASMVGVGILTTSGFIIKDTQSQTLMLVLWLVGGVLALCGALTVAELAAAMPLAGGEYVFIREGYGRPWAFLYGWISFLIGFSAPTAIVAHGAARYLMDPWYDQLGASGVPLVRTLAIFLLVVFTLAHLRGQATSSKVHTISTVLKVVVLAALVFGGFAIGRGSVSHLAPDLPDGGMPFSALGISLVYVMFSYCGWNAATYLAGEIRDPERLLPRALLIGCGAVVALYLLLNLLYVYALDPREVAAMSYDHVEPIAALAARRLLGSWVSAPFSMAIGVGLLASLSAFILTGPRIYYAMALDGLFPAVAARLHPTSRTPNAAILAQSGCALALLFTGTFKSILTYAGVGLSLSAFFVILSVFLLRARRPEMHRPFKIPFYPVPPVLFLACTAWMIVFAFFDQPLWSTLSVGSILAGIPIYYLAVAARDAGRNPVARGQRPSQPPGPETIED